jgi:hypothetical protein
MTEISIEFPSEAAGGVFADFVSVWHSDDVFTLDFAAMTGPPQQVEDITTGDTTTHIAARIVSRVRIPPAQVFEIMKALEQHLSDWERSTGRTSAD